MAVFSTTRRERPAELVEKTPGGIINVYPASGSISSSEDGDHLAPLWKKKWDLLTTVGVSCEVACERKADKEGCARCGLLDISRGQPAYKYGPEWCYALAGEGNKIVSKILFDLEVCKKSLLNLPFS